MAGTVRALGAADLRRARCDMQMIFQDPFASLNPYRRLRDQVAGAAGELRRGARKSAEDKVATLFDRVELRAQLHENASRTSFRAANGSASPLRGRSPPIPS